MLGLLQEITIYHSGEKMKILHIWDICNNSALVTEKLTAAGHQSLVVTRSNYSRKYLIQYYLRVIYHLLTFKADIVHVNAWDKGVLFAKLFSPRSKILMHYHGSDIRWKRVPLVVILFANLLCVSTRDLMGTGLSIPYWPRLLPVLIPDEFYYRGGREVGKTIEIPPGSQNIAYELMPFVLSLGEFYRDCKRRPNITNAQVLSKTGREALLCGTKVITDSGEIVESFPITEFKDYVVIYNEMIC